MSPKLIRWVGGVRCLGLFPKKSRFFFTPSLIADDKVFAALVEGGLYDELNEMGRLQDHLMTVI